MGGNHQADRSFKFSKKATRTKEFKVYVKINGLKSNVLTIPKA